MQDAASGTVLGVHFQTVVISRPPHRSIEKINAGAIVLYGRPGVDPPCLCRKRTCILGAGHRVAVRPIFCAYVLDGAIIAIDSILVPSIRFVFGSFRHIQYCMPMAPILSAPQSLGDVCHMIHPRRGLE